MEVSWSAPQSLKQEGKRKLVEAKWAQGEAPADRFLLYQTHDMIKKIPSMWVLYDQTSKTQHYLHAFGWEEAQNVAAKRIVGIMFPEKRVRRKKP